MTSSNTLKMISIASAALLTIGGSVGVAAPASATAVTNIKSLGYAMAWVPGGTIEATMASTRIAFNSQLEMDDVTSLRGQSLTVASLNTGFANNQGLADNVYITFYASLANRTSNTLIGSGTQIFNTPNSSVTVPANALAMRLSYSSAFNGDSTRIASAGTYGSTPRVYSNTVLIPSTNASSGSNLYLTSSQASVEGATAAFTTPATGTVRSTTFIVAGCFDMSLVTSSTTYTSRLKVNGNIIASGVDHSVSETFGYGAEVNGSSMSFGSGQLATWRSAGKELKVVARNYSNTSLIASATQYDAVLELVDQNSTSLLKDCTPATPSGSGTITASSTPGFLSFTPDSTLGTLSSWTINVYKSSDNSLVTTAPGMGTNPANIMAPFGQSGPGSWTIGESYYARAVNGVTINGANISSGLGTASAAFTIPSNFSSGGGGGGGVQIPQDCNPAIVITNIAFSAPSIDPTSTVRRIYNNDPSIGTSTACLASYALPALGTLITLNGAIVGTPVRNNSVRTSVSNLTTTWTGLTTGQALNGRTLNDGDVYVVNYYVGIAQTPTLSDTPTFSTTLILNPTGTSGGGSVSSSSVAPAPLNAEQARNVLKPVPAAVQPLVPAFLALNKPMASLGGKVALSAGDFTGLVSAQIAGKSLDFILGKTGQITMTVPQGEAGKTADLVLTFNTGSIILQDAIKYVAPVVVAEVPARPISVSSSSKSLSEEAQSEIRQAAFANVKNTAVACVGYAAANTASARGAALALATKACAIANKANSDLAITGINVVVDKLKALTQGVGIKVYKADN